jgi:hypothetical protein
MNNFRNKTKILHDSCIFLVYFGEVIFQLVFAFCSEFAPRAGEGHFVTMNRPVPGQLRLLDEGALTNITENKWSRQPFNASVGSDENYASRMFFLK